MELMRRFHMADSTSVPPPHAVAQMAALINDGAVILVDADITEDGGMVSGRAVAFTDDLVVLATFEGAPANRDPEWRDEKPTSTSSVACWSRATIEGLEVPRADPASRWNLDSEWHGEREVVSGPSVEGCDSTTTVSSRSTFHLQSATSSVNARPST
jgi:hypothetical protein